MWDDYYLKFATEAEYKAQMPELFQELASDSHATDVIGTLYRDDTFTAREGFHINLRLKAGYPLPEPLAAYNVGTPEHPKRVFA